MRSEVRRLHDSRLATRVAHDSANELPTEAPSSGELVAGVDGPRLDERPARAQEQDRQAGAVRLAGSADPGAWATDAPAAAKRPPLEDMISAWSGARW